jgi:threonine dehydrogenase-like Zn-dependent dehydrogenase
MSGKLRGAIGLSRARHSTYTGTTQLTPDASAPPTMKAVAVVPGTAGSAHLRQVPHPLLADGPGGGRRAVKVKVLRVGVDGTDREINAAEYGAAPPGDDYLILGHEGLGRVVEVGAAVTELAVGDYVVATVRRPGTSIYDAIGTSDMTTDDTYFERGINLRHGFLTEYYVEAPEFLVKVPQGLRDVGVLLEPTTVVEKGITQAYEIQRRLRVWRPRRAAVVGAGTIGLLATLALRLRGLEVTTFAKTARPYLNADLIEALGARYENVDDVSVREGGRRFGPFDLIFEASGFGPAAFEAMQALGKNGVLVLSSVTGSDRTVEVPADKINLDFVLGNKVMVGTVNANREYFELGVRDLAMAEAQYPGWLGRLLTDRVAGLENYAQLFERLGSKNGTIKVYCEVAGE